MATQDGFRHTLEAAKNYRSRGWMPVPVPHRKKNPGFQNWQNFIMSESDWSQHFNGQPQNVGVLLGEKSNSLVDIDLDWEEAVLLAQHILPPTFAVFGRPGKRRSPSLYITELKTEKTRFGRSRTTISGAGIRIVAV
jgi:hypothetical protein